MTDTPEYMEQPEPRKKSRHQQAVEAMMNQIPHGVPDRPTMPSPEVRVLRCRLLLEEVLELCEASGVSVAVPCGPVGLIPAHFETLVIKAEREPEPNFVEMADALADISVVNTGAMSAMGIADCSLLFEVDHNNLKKFVELGPCETCGGFGGENPGTPNHDHWHPCPAGCEGRIGSDGKTTLGGYRDEHGKWIKPVNHPKPDIEGVLTEQQGSLLDMIDSEIAAHPEVVPVSGD